MQEEDHREPELQPSPDYQLLMKQMEEAGRTLKRVYDAICKGVSHAVSTIIDALCGIGLYTKPARSKLRLYHHKTQYEKRIAWKASHMQRMHEKEAKIYLRRIGIA